MSHDKLRERFESVFRKPKNVVWSEKHQNYGFTQRKYAYQALRYRAMYIGFKGFFDLLVKEQKAALAEKEQRQGEPVKRTNRVCHIDYTAHPHRCGCLKGDEEAHRRYDEHCRSALERKP